MFSGRVRFEAWAAHPSFDSEWSSFPYVVFRYCVNSPLL